VLFSPALPLKKGGVIYHFMVYTGIYAQLDLNYIKKYSKIDRYAFLPIYY